MKECTKKNLEVLYDVRVGNNLVKSVACSETPQSSLLSLSFLLRHPYIFIYPFHTRYSILKNRFPSLLPPTGAVNEIN